EADHRALDRLQQRQRQYEGERQIDRKLQPHRRRKIGLDRERQRHHDVADDDDHEIGGQVVGAVWGEVETASRTMIVNLQEGAKQFSLAAARAAAAKAALHRAPDVALLADSGFAGPHGGCASYRLHDLPLPDLPDFCLPRLRSLLREAWCGRSFSACWDFRTSRLPSRFLPRCTIRPSDSSSKRSAPATGAASTRRTSTTSPSRCMAPLRVPT